MKIHTSLSFITLLTFHISFLLAQAPALQWQKSYGGSDNDFAFSVQQTTDDGYIVAGQTASFDGNVTGNHGDEDFWVIRLDRTGNLKWQRALGGSGDESAFAVQQTIDGGFIAAGQAASNNGNVTGNHGNLDFWVVKLNSKGNLLWEKSLGGSNPDFATSIQQTSDLGYIVVGGSGSTDGDVTGHHGNVSFLNDYWVVKLDASGNIQWENSFGGTANDIAFSVQQTRDGGYIIGGNSESNDGDVTGMHDLVYGDFWIIRLDKNGNLQWEKSLGGTDYDQANSVQQTVDGGYIAVGFSRSDDGDVTNAHGNYDVWMTKLNSNGSLLWQKTLGGSLEDFGYSVEQTPDGGYIINGGTASNDDDVSGNHGNEDFWVVKTDDLGNLQWQSALGGSSYDEGKSIDQTSEGGYIAAGFSQSTDGNVSGNHGQNDFWITKLFSCNCIPPIDGFKSTGITASSEKIQWDTVGCVLGYKVHYRVSGTNTWTTKNVSGNKGMKKLMQLTPSTTYEWQIASQCSSNTISGFSSIQTFTTPPQREEINNEIIQSASGLNFSFAPNPASDIINLKIESEDENVVLEISDLTGKLIMQKNLSETSNKYDLQVNLNDLHSGIYFMTLKTENDFVTKKLVKQ